MMKQSYPPDDPMVGFWFLRVFKVHPIVYLWALESPPASSCIGQTYTWTNLVAPDPAAQDIRKKVHVQTGNKSI